MSDLTRKICEVMGWEVRMENGDKFIYTADERYLFMLRMFEPSINITHAKLLQARMVADGWRITITQEGSRIMSWAWWPGEGIARHYSESTIGEPAALCQLFVMVYGIKE